MNMRSISEKIGQHQAELERYGVKSLAIFGSVARGEAADESDLDVLVEFSRPVGLFEFIRLKNFLAGLTGCRVDLVTVDAIRPRMRDNILNEAVRVT
jgi:predicted nucleotidyltransferase